jgi:hypothetical protein
MQLIQDLAQWQVSVLAVLKNQVLLKRQVALSQFSSVCYVR